MLRILLLLLALAACGDDLGPPRPHPLPAPDGKPALLVPGPHSTRLASYVLTARLDAAARRIEGTERLTWKNESDREVEDLAFHLYMNAFKNEDSLFMTESKGSHRGIDFSGQHWGWIDVASIRIDGQELRAKASLGDGPDETVMTVPLATPVAPGAQVVVDLTFTTQLPEVFARTGFKDAFLMVGQWFPKIGVRVDALGEPRWECPPFHVASEFFADFGTYDVTLTVPDTHVVAATGVLLASAAGPDGTHVLTYRAEDVHDFVWMADPYMQVIRDTAKVGDHEVEVRVYHRPEQADFARRHLAAGVGAVETFSELFVPYPWAVMSIVDPPVGAAGAAGMEYPTLVTTAGDSWYTPEGVRLPEYVTIHEVGHNWFQGLLASNEVEEAWLDEGINDWADGEVIARLYGESSGLVDWMGVSIELHRLRRAVIAPIASVPSPIATASWAFVDDEAYGEATYAKTALALKTLENLVGRDVFLAAMKAYTEAWAWKHPTGRDFFTTISDELDQDLSWFWRPVFHGTGAVDFHVRAAGCQARHEPRGVFGSGDRRRTVLEHKGTGSYRCEVVVANTGTVSVPVDIEMRFADGSKVVKRWEDRGGESWFPISFDRSSMLTEVVIDPQRKVLLTDGVLDDHLRLTPDEHASARAAARLGFWTHSAMQVTGL